MPTPGSLRVEAARLDRQAADATAAADTLDRAHGQMEHRLDLLLRLHTEEVWSSRAATAARLNLRISGTGQLGRARAEIHDLAVALRREAEHRSNLAAGNRRRADELEAAAAAADNPFLPPHLAPPDYVPYEEPVAVGWGFQ